MQQQILADRRRLEISTKMSPADLALFAGRWSYAGYRSVVSTPGPPGINSASTARARDRRTRNTVTPAVTATHSQPRFLPSRHPVSSTFAGFPAT